MTTIDPILAQQAVTGVLVSWWKMLLMIPPFMAWAWLVSTKLDKDARYYHLNHQMWNALHMGAGAAALAAMLLIPTFWLSWPAGVILLAAPVAAYWKVRNAKVPENQRFRLTSEGLGGKIAARRAARAARRALLQFIDSKGETRPVPVKDDPLLGVHMLAEDVIGPALAGRATRIDLVAGTAGGALAQTVDGLRYKRDPIPSDAAIRLIDFLKDIAGTDVADRRRRQAGKFRVQGPGGETEVALTTSGSSSNQSLRLDFDREKNLHKPFDALGLLPQQIQGLRAFEAMHDRHGIILVGAPPGHGLTTSAYSFLSRHDAYTSNVKTLEREIEVQLLGVDQTQWDPNNPDIDYATALQSILRRDPDIVLTADVRDSQTARIIVEPGMKGPLLYVQQPLPTIPDQIRDWVKKVGDVKEAVRALRAVTNQRLLRTLCQNCRQAYHPSPEQLKRLNIPAKKVQQLFRHSGKVQVKNKIEDCPVCAGTGYLGQTAAFEVMLIDDEGRRILSGGDLKAAMAHARRHNMYYLQEAALSKVVSGETTLEEVARVTSPPAAPPPASPPPAAIKPVPAS